MTVHGLDLLATRHEEGRRFVASLQGVELPQRELPAPRQIEKMKWDAWAKAVNEHYG